LLGRLEAEDRSWIEEGRPGPVKLKSDLVQLHCNFDELGRDVVRLRGGVDELSGIPVELDRNAVELPRPLAQLEDGLAHL